MHKMMTFRSKVWGLALGTGLLGLVTVGAAHAATGPEQTDRLQETAAGSGADLALFQERQTPCTQGDNCKYRITVTNKGPDTYSGTINVLRTASFEFASFKQDSEQELVCTQNLSAVACRAKAVELGAGQSLAFTLSLTVPRRMEGQVRHCALMAYPGAEFEDPYRDLVAIIQSALKLRGVYHGDRMDGEMSEELQEAIQVVRNEEGIGEGAIDADLITALFGPSGLMQGDPNSENDRVCDAFDLPDNALARARRQARGKRLRERRAEQEAQSSQSSYSLRQRGRDWRNIRIDGFD